MNENYRGSHARLLGDLCRSLTTLGMGVQMRDAIPSLTVNADPAAPPGVGVYVLVSTSGAEFVWTAAGIRHPVSDIEGAARRIAEFVRDEQRRASGGPGLGS